MENVCVCEINWMEQRKNEFASLWPSTFCFASKILVEMELIIFLLIVCWFGSDINASFVKFHKKLNALNHMHVRRGLFSFRFQINIDIFSSLSMKISNDYICAIIIDSKYTINGSITTDVVLFIWNVILSISLNISF